MTLKFGFLIDTFDANHALWDPKGQLSEQNRNLGFKLQIFYSGPKQFQSTLPKV